VLPFIRLSVCAGLLLPQELNNEFLTGTSVKVGGRHATSERRMRGGDPCMHPCNRIEVLGLSRFGHDPRDLVD
jgi:hypothetical protein